MNDLTNMILFIQSFYSNFNNEIVDLININLKRKQVFEINSSVEIKQMISKYRSKVNANLLQLVIQLDDVGLTNSKTTCRVKSQNSIDYKINKYTHGKEEGKIPINKCLNDLLGIRIILKEKYSFQDISEHINGKFQELKCINANKGEYVATHIYFRENNSLFHWELQVWSEIDEQSNIASHNKYKQEYTNWEEASREGGVKK